MGIKYRFDGYDPLLYSPFDEVIAYDPLIHSPLDRRFGVYGYEIEEEE